MISLTKARPMGNHLIVRPDNVDVTPGGIHLSQGPAKEGAATGVVLAAGPGAVCVGNNEIMDMTCKEGDRILYPAAFGIEITLGDEKVVTFREEQVLAIV